VRPGVDAEIDAADDVIHRTEVLKFIPFMDGRNVGMIDRTSRLSPSLETGPAPWGPGPTSSGRNFRATNR
jgi:hypothetical protein